MSEVPAVINAVTTFFRDALGRSCMVIAVSQNDQGEWLVKAETPEEVEYMRQRARDDLVGLYQIKLDRKLNVLGYQRIAIRQRHKTGYEDSQER